MSCFSSLSRVIVQLSALSIICIGFGIFGYGCYILCLIFFDNYEGKYNYKIGFFVYDSEWGMFGQKYGALIIGGVLLIFGIIGYLGSTTDRVSCKRSFLFIYHISVVGFACLFLTIAFLMLFGAKKYFDSDCESTDKFKKLSDGVKKADLLFCSIGCPCNLDIKNFDDKSALIGKVWFKSSNYPQSVQRCQLFDSEEYKLPSQFMQILEQDFSCSGWCSKTSLFIFSDVNRGNTNGISCFKRFQDYYRTYVMVVGYLSLGLGILYIITALLIFALYCYFGKQQKQRHQKMYLDLLLR